MNNYLETIIIGIFFTIFAALSYFGGQKNADQISSWIQSEAVVESVWEDEDPDSNHTYYYANVTFTKEDGEECHAENLFLTRKSHPGDVIPIIYDPESGDAEYGDTPPDESGLNNIMFMISSAVAVLTFILAGYQIFRSYHPKPKKS